MLEEWAFYSPCRNWYCKWRDEKNRGKMITMCQLIQIFYRFHVWDIRYDFISNPKWHFPTFYSHDFIFLKGPLLPFIMFSLHKDWIHPWRKSDDFKAHDVFLFKKQGYRTTVGKMQPAERIRAAAAVIKGNIGHSPATGLCVACGHFLPTKKSWEVETETTWSAKPKLCPVWPFSEKVCWSLLQNVTWSTSTYRPLFREGHVLSLLF